MTDTDIAIIGGGASGMMAAFSAASSENRPQVTVLEKMPRPCRKVIITGKGRCNYTNEKDWNAFSPHVRANSNLLRIAFMEFPPDKVIGFFKKNGVESITERGDRVFPASHKSMDIADALYSAAKRAGAEILTGRQVTGISKEGEIFMITLPGGQTLSAKRVIIATGGLSYPTTGSTGDGYDFASTLGLSLKPRFPSLTALVPAGYKQDRGNDGMHIDRSIPLSDTGHLLCGISLKNVGVRLMSGKQCLQEAMGDIDFTDGGIEGPIGFALSRTAVKTMTNGGKVSLEIDLKPGVAEDEYRQRVSGLWKDILSDSRSQGRGARTLASVLCGKLMPKELTAGFLRTTTGIIRQSQKGKESFDLGQFIQATRCWKIAIDGYVGYERCVITAGGVAGDEVSPKTMEARKCKGLYLCGEVLDIDADTGGYNLQTAFSTGYLAGRHAAASLLDGESKSQAKSTNTR